MEAFEYQFPAPLNPEDANWIGCEVELSRSGGSFRGHRHVWMRTLELAQFRDELCALVEPLDGVAELHHLEEEVGCTITLAHGRGTLTAFLLEHTSWELRASEVAGDQSYLPQMLRELDAVLEVFPVRA